MTSSMTLFSSAQGPQGITSTPIPPNLALPKPFFDFLPPNSYNNITPKSLLSWGDIIPIPKAIEDPKTNLSF